MKMKLPPDVIFHHDLRLMVFRPRGILGEKEVRRIVTFLEKEEDRGEKPFNRFTDNSKLDAVDLDFDFMFRISLHRRLTYAKHPRIKSAFHVNSPAVARIVKLHAMLTEGSPIQVKMFKDFDSAAKWLGVSAETLEIGASGI
jgi:hypothetical protein